MTTPKDVKPPREWWLKLYGQENVLPQNRGSWAYDKEQMDYNAGYAEESRKEYYEKHIHVVEHSALEAAERERDEYIHEAERFQNKCIDLGQANGMLKAEIERLHKSMPEFANGVHANLVIQLTEARAQAEKLAEALSDWVKLDPRDATTEAVEALALYAKWKAGG